MLVDGDCHLTVSGLNLAQCATKFSSVHASTNREARGFTTVEVDVGDNEPIPNVLCNTEEVSSRGLVLFGPCHHPIIGYRRS